MDRTTNASSVCTEVASIRWIERAAFAALVTLTGCGAAADPASLDPTLGSVAEARGLRAGTFLFSAAGKPGADNTGFLAALAQFDLWTVPVFFDFVEPQPHQFDFALADAVVEAAPAGRSSTSRG
jgi:hypothetical protein